ncbi:MAG: MMPL family transporter [bacterium]|nr:MMPL family transporter [bacterium]
MSGIYGSKLDGQTLCCDAHDMRENILHWLISTATTRRWIVLLSSVLLTLGLGAVSAHLKIDMRWSALLPETLPVVKEYMTIDENFYQPGNMIVAIGGPDPILLENITDEATDILKKELLCEKSIAVDDCLQQERYARYVYGKLPEEWLREHMLRLAKPKDATRLGRIFKEPRLLPYLTHLNDDFEAEYSDSENVKNQERQIVSSLDALQQFVETLNAAAGGEEVSEDQLARIIRDLTLGRPYMFSLDNSMSLIMVSSAVPTDDFETTPLLDKKIERLLAPLNEKYADFSIERTGMTAVGRDEMDSVGPYTIAITIGAMLAIFLLLVWYFRSVVTPLLALVPIIAGIIWTTGFIALTLGTMNLMTMMIMVVLLGLGIDFSIHIASRYHEESAAGKSIEEALYCAIDETGKGVITGAITTAVAFATLMIAGTKGIKEFGFCAASGVVITLLAVLWILPALLAFRTARRASKAKASETAHDFRALGRFAALMGRMRLQAIVLILGLTLAGFWAGSQLEWEWNFNKLEPAGLRSVELQDEIIEKYKLSISMSLLSVERVEESRELRKKLKEKSLIGDVDDISLWVSRPDFHESLRHISRLRDSLAEREGIFEAFTSAESSDSESVDEDRGLLADELDRLWANVVEMQALSFTGGQDRVVEKSTQLVAKRENRAEGLLQRVAERFLAAEDIDWESFQRFARTFDRLLRRQIHEMTRGDSPVTLKMVPDEIRAKYTSPATSGFLMQILPKQNLYEKEELELFQEVTAKIHPNVTGLPQMILKMNTETLREGKLASMAAIGVILVVLLLDFRKHPFLAPLAFLPLISGVGLMLGSMWLLGEKLNYLNMIAFPVIIGIGVDDGVHFFHRVLQEGRDGLERAVTSVGRAMLMTSLTTMIGFGSLMFYLMQGMASLGLALFIGVGMCFVVTVTLLPALTRLFGPLIFHNELRK